MPEELAVRLKKLPQGPRSLMVGQAQMWPAEKFTLILMEYRAQALVRNLRLQLKPLTKTESKPGKTKNTKLCRES